MSPGYGDALCLWNLSDNTGSEQADNKEQEQGSNFED